MKPETFVILIPGFAANEADSTCLPSQQLFVKLLKEKFPDLNVVVIAFQYPFTSGEYNLYNCSVISLGGKGRSKLFRLLLWRKAWKILRALNLKNNVIGLLSFWCGECALVGKRFSKKFNVPHYCWIMGQDAKKDNRYVKRIKPSCNELISISDFIQKEFENNHGIRPKHVIPLGISTAEFGEENIERSIDVLGVGSLIPLKQFSIFVEVILMLQKEFPALNVIISGKGPEEEKLRQQVRESNLESNLQFTDELPHKLILQHMQRSKIFLHASNYEGFAAVFLEALYAGAQVISFCKPMNEAISHWHIVQTKEEMINKAIEILRNPSLEYNPVLPYTLQDSIENIMKLFGK